MPTIPEELLQRITTRVARQMAGGAVSPDPLPRSIVLLFLPGEAPTPEAVLGRLAEAESPIVAVPDCASASARALAASRARLSSLVVLAEGSDLDAALDRATRIVAPSLDLALASRVAALQTDTLGARAVVRGLL